MYENNHSALNAKLELFPLCFATFCGRCAAQTLKKSLNYLDKLKGHE